MKKKLLVALTALVLVVCFAVGGTLAWIKTSTTPVTNTFTYGDINIALAETTGDEYKMIPGSDITKDPTVTVKENSEACWLFVKIEKSANFDTFMTYAVAEGWIALTGVAGVYYREVAATTADTDYEVLAGNKVTVKTDVTKAQFEALGSNLPTLTFTAYAVQSANVEDAATAWGIANP